EARAGVAEGVLRDAAELPADLDGVRGAGDGEVAHRHRVFTVELHAGALVGQVRVLLDVEEVDAHEVAVTLLVARADARRVDVDPRGAMVERSRAPRA